MPEYRQGRVCPRGHDDGTGHSIRFASNYVCVRCSELRAEQRRLDRMLDGAHAIARARDDTIRSLHYRDGVRLRDIPILLRVHRDTVRMALYSDRLDTMNGPHVAPNEDERAQRLDTAKIIDCAMLFQCTEDGCTETAAQQYEVLGDDAYGPWNTPACAKHLTRELLERRYPKAAK